MCFSPMFRSQSSRNAVPGFRIIRYHSWLPRRSLQFHLRGHQERDGTGLDGTGLDGDTKQKNKDKKNLESCGGGFQYIYPKQRYM